MLLAAFALGLWFGWLAEIFRREHGSQLRRLSQSTLFLAVLGAAFVVGACLLVFSLLAQHLGIWDSLALRFVNFVTARAQVGAITAFIAGWLCYRKRPAIFAFLRLRDADTPTPHRGRDRSDDEKKSSSETSAGTTFTRTARLLILGAAMVFVGILYFIPELKTRLQSLKFGDVEARFVSATQNSARMSSPDTGFLTPTMINESRSRRLAEELKVVDRIRQAIAASRSIPPDVATAEGKLTNHFYRKVGFPAAEAVACYLSVSSLVKENLRVDANAVARKWIKFSTDVYATDAKTQNRVLTDTEIDERFKQVVDSTFALIKSIENVIPKTDRSSEWSECKNVSSAVPSQSRDPFKGNVSELMSHGYVISFVGGLAASVVGYQESVQYLNQMGLFLNKGETQLPEQMYFYAKRDEAKGFARWYPPDELSDLSQARDLAARIMATLRLSTSKSDSRIISFVATRQANITNSELYFLAHHWEVGNRLSPDEIDSLEGLSKELQTWLNSQSVTALADQLRGDPLIDDPLIGDRLNLVAGGLDTVVLAEFAIGELRQDRNDDRCGRIAGWLARSRRAFELGQEKGVKTKPEYRAVFRTLDAHYEMYRSICTS